MNLGALLDIVREELDDTVEPYLWSNEFLADCATDAQNEACRRARLLIDSSTEDIADIEIEAATHTYDLDPRVIRVERAIVAGETLPLRFVLRRDMDVIRPGWEDEAAGTPEFIIPDWSSRKVRLHPTPDADGTLRMTVIRLPLLPVNDLDDEFEIPEHFQRNLRHWVKHRAYLKSDSETLDKQASADALAMFVDEFGRSQPAYDEAWVQSHYMDRENGRF